MIHQSLLALLILNLFNPGRCHAQMSDLKSKLCQTWVSYEQISHSKLLDRTVTHKTTGSAKDSLIISENFNVERFHRNRVCNGTWKFSEDSTKVVFKFPDCKNFYYSLGSEEFILETLLGDSVKMLCDFDEEGAFSERWFRITEK